MGSARRMPAWTSRESLRAARRASGIRTAGGRAGPRRSPASGDRGSRTAGSAGQAALDDAQRPATHLQPARQARGELGQAMVHERAARFEAVRHAHAVGDHHRMIGQAHLLSAYSIRSSGSPGARPVRIAIAASADVAAELPARPPASAALPRLAIEVEVGQARRVAVGALEERELVQPAQLMADALVPARFRESATAAAAARRAAWPPESRRSDRRTGCRSSGRSRRTARRRRRRRSRP